MPVLRTPALALCTLIAAGAHAQPQPASSPTPPVPREGAPAPAGELPVPKPAEQPPDVPFTTDPRVEYVLDAEGNWVATNAPAAGSDAAVMADARRLIADGEPSKAKTILDQWINTHSRGDSPYLPQAYLLRGDATTANGDEFGALYDYEALIRQFPASPEFVKAIERELEIATAYVRGMNRKWLGIRWVDGSDTGVELLIRVQERLPNSRLAEQAGIELADFYYRTKELSLASEAYDLFLKNYPQSVYRSRALQRQVYANIGRYKGPAYDGSSLLDSRVLIRRYMSMYPASAEEAGLDEALLTRIDESAASQMLETAKWYLIRDDPVSARSMLRRLLKKHPQSAAAGVALKMMEEKGWIALNRTVPGALGPAGAPGAVELPPSFEPAPPPPPPALGAGACERRWPMNVRAITRVVSVLGACAVALCAACTSSPRDGYSFSSTYRDDIKSVAVPVWGNNTYSHGLELQLTEAIVSEIKRATPWRVTDPEAAQTTLTGTITHTDLKKLTTGRDTGLGETLAVVITVNFEWKDNATGRTITARRDFESSDTFVPAEGYKERLSVGEIATIQRLARDVVTELRSAW